MTRREWLAGSLIGAAMALPASQALGTWLQQAAEPIDPQLPSRRPNILLIIADDLGYPHTGADGMTVVPTPHIDRLANQGARFTRAFVPSPSCSPSRASILTGQTPNRLGMGGVLSGPLDDQHPRYPDLLKAAGYHVGSTGKGYGPAWLDKDKLVKTGPQFPSFAEFLKQRPDGAPFCFWFGSQNPHRPFLQKTTTERGVKPEDVPVPPFLVDTPETRRDLAHYYAEIAEFDDEIGQLVAAVTEIGEAENTIIVICSDNGMPFPRAKATLYDAGAQSPLIVHWPAHVAPGQVVSDFVNLADLAPTFLQAAGVEVPNQMNAASILPLMIPGHNDATIPPGASVAPARDAVFLVREQHVPHNDKGGYSSRAIRTEEHLYVLNLTPERWPAGPPDQKNDQFPNGFPDVDEANAPDNIRQRGGGAKEAIVRDFEHGGRLGMLALGKRPAEELYLLKDDPHQMHNVADDPRYASIKEQLGARLRAWMNDSNDGGVVAVAP